MKITKNVKSDAELQESVRAIVEYCNAHNTEDGIGCSDNCIFREKGVICALQFPDEWVVQNFLKKDFSNNINQD